MSELLLTSLHELANSAGLVMAREEALVTRLNVDRAALEQELGMLEQEGAIRILSPLPFLALKLKAWSGRAENKANSGQSPHSYTLLQSQRLNSSYRRSEDVLPTNDLLHEILETLGETDASSFEKAVELYSPHVIRTALDRVRRTRGIRKSRTALFRHLLPRLAR